MLLPVVLVLAQNDHKGSDLNKAANKGSDHKGARAARPLPQPAAAHRAAGGAAAAQERRAE